MWPVPVVVVEPSGELLFSLLRVFVRTSISPLSEGGLDEAFGLTVGAWSIGFGEAVLDAEVAAQGSQSPRVIGRSVVGQDGLEAYAQPAIPGQGRSQERDHRLLLLVGVDGRVGQP